ncbi:Alpha-ribazole phosphatase [Trichostrongylus colubriformis]|uniref:Alpha-ribazole phosphatase n=1 Tax=Trichostrongylus colubriformis TaxID=6319 RepID=A0AAN8ETU3_TRICO
MPRDRIIWVVRHAEREDNVNPNWQSLPEARGLNNDNPMLSARGRKQARECAARFRDVNIDHLFASPFDRTMETASIIAEEKELLVKPEAGLCEVLTECNNPPGFWSTKRLKRKFIWVDADYVPVYEKGTLPDELVGDHSCMPRIRRTVDHITNNYEGDLLLVSHGAPIAALHQLWGTNFTYVGQATVSKFIQSGDNIHVIFSSDATHLSEKSNLRHF